MVTHPNFLNVHSAGKLKCPTKAVIIGRFPPTQNAQTLEAMRLSLSYLSQCEEFHTITGLPASDAQMKFSVKSRAKFAMAQQNIIKSISSAPRTTLFCDMFTRPTLASKIRYHRFLEYIRLMRLFWTILIQSNDLSVVHSNTKNHFLKLILKIAEWKRKRPIHSLKTTGAAQRLIKRANHPILAPFELSTAIEKLHAHSIENLPKAPPVVPSSLSIYGLSNSPTGLGQNARMSAQCFQKLGLAPCMIDVEAMKWQQNLASPNALTHPVHLHHLNADRVKPMDQTAYNIGFLLWEFQALPKEHVTGISAMDEIWTPSKFVTDIYRKQTDNPVITMKKGIEPLAQIKSRANPKKFTLLNAFDFHSSVERKNPLASAHGFQVAFPQKSHPDCQLILKTTPTEPKHWGDPNDQIGKLREMSSLDPRIILIESFCSTSQFHQMIADASAVISTHRAEGFGYIPAYALLYNRPVITTGYGGVTDFCTPATATLLPTQLIPTASNHTILETKGASWADVSPDAVAEKMLWVYENQDAAAVKAQKGQLLMKTEYSMSAQADRYRKRLIDLGFWQQKHLQKPFT
ncbi:glycosyltransferase family 4 protein [Amylibacter sp. SFDW26]|uniref:glycosyltransferase n=1 Tax=Amylibacter sp. SFDW26 TaxID=2652722 RepID=UPI001261EF4F|nr:hypothetical protein [Amylibacter sp. SFDW26]KAB7615387.1 glycosyltransferase family 4 protein [Amylibacter sp. SFDW26]